MKNLSITRFGFVYWWPRRFGARNGVVIVWLGLRISWEWAATP